MSDDIIGKMQRIIASDHCVADQMCADCPCKETANRIISEIMSPAIERLRAENEKLREALTDAAGELQHAYIMSFKDQYRDAARAARKAVESLQENKDEN